MSEQQYDPWATTSGLPLADAPVEVVDLTFGFNPNIGGGMALCGNFVFRDLESGDQHEQSFSTGDAWEAIEKGAAAQKNSGIGKQQFSSSSNMGRLVDSAIALPGAAAVLRTRGGGMPSRAATWIGTRWRTGTTKVKVMNPSTKEEKERDAIIFVEFLGVGDGAAPAASTSTPAATVGTAGTQANGTGLSGALKAKLLTLAKDAADHDAFMADALELSEVDGNQEAVSAIVDSSAGSIWAMAKG